MSVRRPSMVRSPATDGSTASPTSGRFRPSTPSATSDAGRGPRSPSQSSTGTPASDDRVEVRLRDAVFAGEARVTTLTADSGPGRPAGARTSKARRSKRVSETGKGDVIVVSVPPALVHGDRVGDSGDQVTVLASGGVPEPDVEI